MDAADKTVARAALAQHSKVPIAQLSPTLEQIQEKCIDATVTLVWPYSSSTKSLSLLLAEPDFRLRRSHGQVKATFHGKIAEQVATSHVGIGDNVCLALKGTKFVGNDAATQTPGRYVAWELHFESGLSLEVKRPSNNAVTISLDPFDPAPRAPEQSPPSTPRVVSTPSEGLEQALWESPAFLRPSSTRLSGVHRASLNGAGDEDGSVPGKGRKRPRYSLNRDDWHLVEDPMSPQEKELVSNWWEKDSWEKNSEDNSDDESGVEACEEPEPEPKSNVPATDVEAEAQGSSDPAPTEASPIFIKPSLEPLGVIPDEQLLQTNDSIAAPVSTNPFHNPLLSHYQLPTDTPQLRPIPSPGLPIPSPIVSHPSEAGGYFSETRAFYAPTHSASLGAAASIAVSEPTPLSNISPVSSPSAPEAPFENYPSAMEIDQPTLTPVGLAIDEFALPATPAEQQAGNDLSVEEREKSISSLDDAEVDESAIPQGNIAEHLSSAETAQAVVESMELGAVQEKSVNHVSYDVDRGEDPDTNAKSKDAENEAGEEAPEAERTVTNASRYEDNMSDNDITRATSEVEEEPLDDEPSSVASQSEQYHHPHRRSVSNGENNVAEEEPTDDESFSGSSQPEQHHGFRRPSGNDDESNAAEDDFFEEASEEEPVSDHQDEYSDDQSDEESYESDAEDLPRQSGPPEVIVLDSDSEDELTSDHPVVPQSAYHDHTGCRLSPPRSEGEEYDMGERDEGSDEETDEEADEVEESEPNEDSEPDNRSQYDDGPGSDDIRADMEPVGLDELSNASDKEYESSLDVLARDHYPVQGSRRGSSVHEDDANEDADALLTRAEEISHGDDHHDESVKAHSNTDSIIYLESDGDDSSDDEESTFPREDSAPASRIEKAWSGKYSQTLDGTDDRDFEPTAISAEPNQQAERDTEATLDKSTGQQLLTRDPAQEMAPGLQAAAIGAEQVPDQDTQVSSLGLNLSLPPTSELTPIAPALAMDHDMSPPHLKQEPTPDVATEVLTNKDSPSIPLIIVPTTETVSPQEQPETTRGQNSATSNGVVIQLPVPDRHAHGLQSKNSYFTPLATLADHVGTLVDTISIVHEASPISKATGSKEFFVTVQITDPSMAGTTLKAQISRRSKSTMPTLVEGNAVLFRNFKVQSQDNSITLISTQNSFTAVFDGSGPEAQPNGPPAEYHSEERAFATGLRNWYADIGAHMVADHQLQSSIQRDDSDREGSALISESGSVDSVSRDPTSSTRSRRRRSHRRVTIHELRDGRRYAEVGSPSTKESIHELRDGTVYANV